MQLQQSSAAPHAGVHDFHGNFRARVCKQAWQDLMQQLGPLWQAAVAELSGLLQQPHKALDIVSVRLKESKVGPADCAAS